MIPMSVEYIVCSISVKRGFPLYILETSVYRLNRLDRSYLVASSHATIKSIAGNTVHNICACLEIAQE